MRVLIVEDNQDIAANIAGYLGPLGHSLDFAVNGYGGLALMSEHEYDVVVLDLGLPGIDGIELCRKIRTELRKATPVLMLTARDTIDDKVVGFESGADDYLVKPFALAELEARLKALARRGQPGDEAVLRVGDLSFDTHTYEVLCAGRALTLAKTGYRILACLMRQSPRVVEREALEAEIWGDDRPDSDALRTHIHALRQALDKAGHAAMLKTVQGIGYRLMKERDGQGS
jgi:DNA-binding response OmpR family regulator